MTSLNLIIILSLMGCGLRSPLGPSGGAETSWQLVSAEEMEAVSTRLPEEPAEAAIALVQLIHGPDEGTAQAATGELLRRAGIPLVSVDGPIVGLPDDLVLVDAGIYINFVTELTRATRRNDSYSPEQLADLLAEVGVTGGRLPSDSLIAGLGHWGKAPDAPVESQVAGAAVRALAGRRLEVLYGGADLGAIEFDPLQTVLILAHATSRSWPRLDTGARILPGGRLAAPAPRQRGPCDSLAQAMKDRGLVEEVTTDATKDQIIDSWIESALSENAARAVKLGQAVYEKGSAVLSTLLLLLGAQIRVSDNRSGQTHFWHSKGETSKNVTLTAYAHFDSTIAATKVACYQLAGIDVPRPGPLVGFRVRWSIDQQLGRGYQGRFLTTASDADSRKVDACGTCGEVTGQNGTSTLELRPARELIPEKGPEHTGYVTVKASLDKDDFPFKLKDLLGLRNPLGFVVDKTFDLAMSAIQRAGLPSQAHTIRVDYHGNDILIARGETTLFLFYTTAPLSLDVYTCDGLDGQWHGRGGLGAEALTFIGEAVVDLLDVDAQPADIFRDFNFHINPDAYESPFDIVPELKMTGVMRIDRILIAAQRVIIVGQTAGRPVGEVEVLIDGVSPGLLSLGGSTTYPVIWMPFDDRCPGGGSTFD